MRPRSLLINGLTSFHNQVTLDFTDASLFALVGPTGAGKSSVVDALTLALYGRIPRLHANEIAPVISTTGTECTVGLEFTVRRQPYRAVRTIRRTKTGASTLEAALEQLTDEGKVASTLAGTADDVTAEVETLLGLTFEEFTRAVVLPQGDFARVLKATASDRQKLLARLLGTGIYERVKQRAGAHGRAAQDRAEQIAHQIAQLGAVDQAHITDQQQRVTGLGQLIDALTDDTDSLTEIRERFRDATITAKGLRDRVQRLRAIQQPPPEVKRLAGQIAQAEQAQGKFRQAQEDAEQQLTTAEDAAGDPERLEALNALITAHGRTTELTQALTDADTALPQLRDHIGGLTVELSTATAAVGKTTLAQNHVQRQHAAVQAAEGLGPGDNCPVCAATLNQQAPALQPEASAAKDAVAEAGRTVNAAVQAVASLQTRLTRAETDLQQATASRDAAKERLQVHLTAVEGKPDLAAAQRQLADARTQQQQLVGLRAEAKQARADLQRATTARQHLSDQATGLRDRLDRLRLAVADADPPVLSGEVVTDWTSLHGWAQQQLPVATMTASEADQAAEAVQGQGTRLRAAMEQACTDAGVPEGTGDPRDRAVDARATAAAEVGRLTHLAKMAADMQVEQTDAREQAVVGTELARLLRTDQFQKWLLDEATRALVAGASVKLSDLSSGRYQLTLDGRSSIQVTDLSSAGMTRSVRTLSGGETFLASLALALSLAEQIALSATGPVALESLFIDEGFGALDPETLDVAAGAIEQLGAGDRTVGVITHVAEMADRLPTRFVVSRTGAGSRVERVDA